MYCHTEKKTMEGLTFSCVLVLWILPQGLNGTVTPDLYHSTSSRTRGNEGTLKFSGNPQTTVELSTLTWISDIRSTALTQTRPDTTVPVAMESDFDISATTMQPNTTKDQSGMTSVVVVPTTKTDSSTTASDAPFPTTQSQVSTLEMTTASPRSTEEQPTDQHLATPSDSTPAGSTIMSETNPTTSTTVSKAVDMTTSTKGLVTQMVTTETITASTITAVATKKEPTDGPTKSTNQKGPKDTGNHGTVVAALIGGALIIMMLGFAVIFLRRRKHMTNAEWAGPSPFLDGVINDDANGHVQLRGSQRISLAGFLPQRLSTRLSLLKNNNTDYNMEEIPGSTFGRELSAGDVEPSNETNLGAKEIEDQESPSSISPKITSTDHDSDAKTPASTEDKASSSDHLDGQPLSPPNDSLPLMDVDLSPHLDTTSSEPNTAGSIIPPAPPLPS